MNRNGCWFPFFIYVTILQMDRLARVFLQNDQVVPEKVLKLPKREFLIINLDP